MGALNFLHFLNSVGYSKFPPIFNGPNSTGGSISVCYLYKRILIIQGGSTEEIIGGDQSEKCGPFFEKCGPFLNRASERRRPERRSHVAILGGYGGQKNLKAVRAFWAHLEMEIIGYLTFFKQHIIRRES